jgi:hypothetical protein
MNATSSPTFRLVPRGRAGLACDDEGVSLGPVTLVDAFRDADGWLRFRSRPAAEIDEALTLAYGARLGGLLARRRRSLSHIAELLTAGEGARARLHALLMGFPDIDDEGMAKLSRLHRPTRDDAAERSPITVVMCGAQARRSGLHQDEPNRRSRMRDRSRCRDRDSDPRHAPLRDGS